MDSVFWASGGKSGHRPFFGPNFEETDLAYILYTSGSTGNPKGVMISHRAALAFVNWCYECFEVRGADRVSSHAPFHFDLSIFDIYVTAKAGATLVLVPEELSLFPIELADFISTQQISIWYSVPSVLTRLLTYGKLERHQFRDLQKILFAGEVFPVKHLRQLMGLFQSSEFFNLYGPTETNVCTFYHVQDLPSDSSSLPIGRACPYSRTWALNEAGQLARQGDTGELYVAGDSLMDGYWGKQKESEAVLAPRVFPDGTHVERTYRTGDLVTLDANENYVFHGRRDEMVKSRGYRIELGEIECLINAHEKVQEAAVFAIPDEDLGNAICAVIVEQDGCELSTKHLKTYCSDHLPAYMIPERVEVWRKLPRTQTGKIDKVLLSNTFTVPPNSGKELK